MVTRRSITDKKIILRFDTHEDENIKLKNFIAAMNNNPNDSITNDEYSSDSSDLDDRSDISEKENSDEDYFSDWSGNYYSDESSDEGISLATPLLKRTRKHRNASTILDIPQTIGIDNSSFQSTMIIYDKQIFSKYFKDIFDLKLLDDAISFTSEYDKKNHYFVTIPELINHESSIITIKYIETIVLQILCNYKDHHRGNEKINNFTSKPLVIKYETIREMINIMDINNPNANKTCIDNLNKFPYELCDPYHFKINKIHTDYYVSNTVHNFRGMSCKLINDKKHVCKPKKWCGSFNYVNKEFLYKFIVLNEAKAINYCMSECTTSYFKYFLDLDFNDKACNYVKSKNSKFNFMAFWDYVINLLIPVLEYFIDTSNNKNITLYIFARKRLCDFKIHLHFPNIIINAVYAVEIKKELMRRILIEDIYEIRDYIDDIIDERPYRTSLRLPYQTKCGEKYSYDLDREKSTFPLKNAEKYEKLLKKRTSNLTQKDIETIAIIRFKRLQLTSIATDHTNINFVKMLDNEGNALFDKNLYKDCGEHGSYFDERQGNNIVIRKKKKSTSANVNIQTVNQYSEKDENGNEMTMATKGIKINVAEDKEIINGYIFADMDEHKQCNFVITVSLLEKILSNLAFCRSLNYKEWKQLMFFCKNYNLKNLAHQLSLNDKYNERYIEEILNYQDECVCGKQSEQALQDGLNTNEECFHKIDILTILAFLKKDHKTMYEEIMQENNNEAFYISVESNENNKKNFLKEIISYGLENNLITYDHRYVQELDVNFNIILIKSGLGTGKTVSVIELIRKLLHIKKPKRQPQVSALIEYKRDVGLYNKYNIKKVDASTQEASLSPVIKRKQVEVNNLTVVVPATPVIPDVEPEEPEEVFVGEKLNSSCTISSRKTLTYDHQKSFMYNSVELTHYSDKNIEFNNNSNICITPDSLIRIIKNLGSITKANECNINAYEFSFLPEIVCIDEITSCLDYVGTSNTLKDKRVPVFMTLVHFMRNAKKLILMDGHLSSWDVQFISKVLETRDEELNKEKIEGFKIIYNKQKTEHNHYLFQSADDLKHNLLNALENNKRVFICCDSKLRANIFEKFIKSKFPNKNVKVYTSESSDKDKKEIANCEEEWIKYDAVICSPLIIYGVDFSKIHFHQGFGYYKKIINPRSIHQQILRIRSYIDNIVNIHVTGIDIDFYRNLYVAKNVGVVVSEPETKEKYKKYSSILPNNKFIHTNYISRKENESKIIKEEVINNKNIVISENIQENVEVVCLNDLISKRLEMIQLQINELKNNRDFYNTCTSIQDFDEKIHDIIKNGSHVYLIESAHKYSFEQLYNELSEHCKSETNLNTNFFGYKLLDNLTEYGSKVYYSQRRAVPNNKLREIKAQMIKARKECVLEYKEALIKASKKKDEYNTIIMNLDDKTMEDNYIIAACKIMDVFAVDKLNKKFLDFIGDTYYIDTFLNSSIFSMSNKSKKAYLAKLKGDFKVNVKYLIKKTIILEELMCIFFPEGLASNSVCIVSNHQEDLTNEQKNYVRKYKKYIHLYFPNLLKNVNYDEKNIFMINKEAITPNTLMRWLKSMVKNYFGFNIEKIQSGFNMNIGKCIEEKISMVSKDYCSSTEDLRKSDVNPREYIDAEARLSSLLEVGKCKLPKNKSKQQRITDDDEAEILSLVKISKRKSSNSKDERRKINVGTGDNKKYYYCYALNQLAYLEILLNAKKLCLDSELIHKIIKNFKGHKCIFSDLHQENNFFDMICEMDTYRNFYNEKEAVETFNFDDYTGSDDEEIRNDENVDMTHNDDTRDCEFIVDMNEEYINKFNFDTDNENDGTEGDTDDENDDTGKNIDII